MMQPKHLTTQELCNVLSNDELVLALQNKLLQALEVVQKLTQHVGNTAITYPYVDGNDESHLLEEVLEQLLDVEDSKEVDRLIVTAYACNEQNEQTVDEYIDFITLTLEEYDL